MSRRHCIVSMCANELGPKSKSDMCPTCRKGLRYWDDRPYADILEYQRKLQMRRARLGYIAKPKPKQRGRVAVGKSTQAEARA